MLRYSILVIFLLGVAWSEEENQLRPSQLKKFHDVFVWEDPKTWLHHRDHLNRMCDMVKGHSVNTSPHMRDIVFCCDKMSTFERYQCLKAMQEDFLNYCCSHDSMKDSNRCCSLPGQERYSCLHANVPKNPTCVPKYNFNSQFRAEWTRDGVESIGDALRAGLSTEDNHRFMTWGKHEGSAASEQREEVAVVPEPEPEQEVKSEQEVRSELEEVEIVDVPALKESKDSSSSEEEEKENKENKDSSSEEEEDIPDWLTPEGLDKELAGMEEECANEDDVFPESGVEELDDAVVGEVCEDENKPRCSVCCKIGAYVGKKYVKKDPQKQCRRLFVRFYRAHKKCIKRPRICGFFFVKCCVRQHHKDMYATPTY